MTKNLKESCSLTPRECLGGIDFVYGRPRAKVQQIVGQGAYVLTFTFSLLCLKKCLAKLYIFLTFIIFNFLVRTLQFTIIFFICIAHE